MYVVTQLSVLKLIHMNWITILKHSRGQAKFKGGQAKLKGGQMLPPPPPERNPGIWQFDVQISNHWYLNYIDHFIAQGYNSEAVLYVVSSPTELWMVRITVHLLTNQISLIVIVLGTRLLDYSSWCVVCLVKLATHGCQVLPFQSRQSTIPSRTYAVLNSYWLLS